MESVLKPTAKQVAHEAGVSIAAVSRAFSPGSSIDPLKRQRILQVAAQLGYSSPARRTAEVISAGMANACRQHGIRVVLLNRIQRNVRVNAVACDNHAGGRDAALFLLGRGRRRIGFIGGISNTSTHRDRAEGFSEALRESGHSVLAEGNGEFTYRGSYGAVLSLLTAKNRPDALFCCNDIMALAAIDAARELGLSAPEDLSIVGFDDIPMAGWRSYRLTTIRQPITRMISEVVGLIQASKTVPLDETTTSILPGKLIVRGSA
ncbi:MAG: LacI family transcriptional regulator [Rhizobiaceae bacterium]|nr:MAG: LacI family transcriptional regulator [Rhizobiaceae bacterium]